MLRTLIFMFFTILVSVWSQNYTVVYKDDDFSIANVFNASTSYDIMFVFPDNTAKIVYTDMFENIMFVKKIEELRELITVGYTNINRSYDNLLIHVDSKARILSAITVGEYYYNETPKYFYRINYIYMLIGLRGYRIYDSIYVLFFDGTLKVVDYLIFEFNEEVGIWYADFLGKLNPIGLNIKARSKSGKVYDIEVFGNAKYNVINADSEVRAKYLKPSINRYQYMEKMVRI